MTFGGVPALFAVTFDDTTILCASPEGDPGETVDIAVSNSNGVASLSDGFSFFATPEILTASPFPRTSFD